MELTKNDLHRKDAKTIDIVSGPRRCTKIASFQNPSSNSANVPSSQILS